MPKGDLVSHCGYAGQAANAAKRGGSNRDHDRRAAIEQGQTVGGATDDHLRQHWCSLDDAGDILKHHLRLLLRPSQAQHDAALAQNQLRAIVDHGREIDQQGRNGSRFAAAPANDAPQFVDPLARSRSRPVSLAKIDRSSSVEASPMAAMSKTRQASQLSPPNAAPKRCLSLRARRMVTKGVMFAY